MISAAEERLIAYVSYCMAQEYQARRANSYERMFAFRRLARNLLSAHAHLESLRDNLINHWPKFIDAPEGFTEACQEVRQLIEKDMCYPVVEQFCTRWESLQPGPEWYAVRDVVQRLEEHGGKEALWYLRLDAGNLENEIQHGYPEPWRPKKLAIYQEAIVAIEAELAKQMEVMALA